MNRRIFKLRHGDETEILTGLTVKKAFIEKAEKMRLKKDRNYAYVKFDILNFKCINEMFSYEQGDGVLKYIADNIKCFLMKNECATRDDADIFSMFLKYETKEQLEDRVTTFLKSLELVKVGDNLIVHHIVFKCGICMLESGMSISQAISYADLAKKDISYSIGTEIRFFDKDMHEKYLAEKQLENEMSEALENKEFEVYLQPKYDIGTEKIIGAEALIRWNHPKRGLLTPGSFIEIFEKNGFITKIDYFVLETVCSYIKKVMELGREPVRISVNLSRKHFANTFLVQDLIQIVDRYKVPRKYIEFEITETSVFVDMQSMILMLQGIKSAGFAIAMDDFGTGYSSLNMLSKMPIDVLKLDKEFIKECENVTAQKDRSVISHVISMAKDLNMEVIAEGVENEKQKEFLKESNCDTIQGFYYSKPVKIDEFERLCYS